MPNGKKRIEQGNLYLIFPKKETTMAPKYILRNEHSDVVFKGRLGEDAKYNAEHDVTNLRVAVTRVWPNKNFVEGQPESESNRRFEGITAWMNIAVWKNGAQQLAGLKSGDIVEVSCNIADFVAEAFKRNNGEDGAGLKITRARVSLIWSKYSSGEQSSYEAAMEAEPEMAGAIEL